MNRESEDVTDVNVHTGRRRRNVGDSRKQIYEVIAVKFQGK